MDIPQTHASGQSPGWENARWVRPLLFLALAFPAFLPFNFVYRFGVNVPYWDQWDFVPILMKFHEGQLTLDELTAQHNEHRIFFPKLIMLGLAALTRYNTVAEMYFNAGLLVALGAVLLLAHVRTFGTSNRSLLAFLPVPWFVFTFRQYENLLWGWQLQITLCALCAVVSLWLLTEVRGLGARWAGAVAASFVGTFSFGSGIALWPAGLAVLLWQGRREGRIPWRAVMGWSLTAALALGLYAWNFQRPVHHPSPFSFLKAPADSLQFLLATLGSPVSDAFGTALAFGVLFLVALGIMLHELRRRRMDPAPMGLALGLILFVGATATLVLIGRAGVGKDFGMSSRYTTLTLLGFAGLHRAILTLQEPSRRNLLLGILLSAMVTTAAWTFTHGISTGYDFRNAFRRNRQAILAIDKAQDPELQGLHPHAPTVREHTANLRRMGLSVFSPKR